jgi:hypothetical protein
MATGPTVRTTSAIKTQTNQAMSEIFADEALSSNGRPERVAQRTVAPPALWFSLCGDLAAR